MSEKAPILLFEHEKKYCEEVGLSDEEVRRLGSYLFRLRLRKFEPLKILKSERGYQIAASDHVGVLRFGERTIEVLPKLFKETIPAEPDQRLDLRRKATRNLLALLSLGEFGIVRETGRAALLAERTDWFEVLTFLFAINLHRELVIGPPAAYVTREEALSLVRGRILFEQMVRRPASAHQHSCRYDDFTLDNPLNRVFLYACRFLARLSRLRENHSILNDCIARLQDEVETVPFLSADQAESVVLNRLNERFKPVHQMACLFLRGTSIQMTSGKVDAYAFFMDMNRVFEGAVIGLLSRYRGALGEPWSEMRPEPHSQRFLATRFPEGKAVFQLQPDLVFWSHGSASLVIDAKYKWLIPDSGRWEVNPDDFYQMLAYATGLPGVEKVLLVYPWVGEQPDGFPRFRVNGFPRPDFEILVGVLPLDSPLSEASVGWEVVSSLAKVIRGGYHERRVVSGVS